MIGLFEGMKHASEFGTLLTLSELGPCNVTANLTTQVNPYSWTEVSNMLFISQPLGVGFSYGNEQVGSLNPCMSLEISVLKVQQLTGDTRHCCLRECFFRRSPRQISCHKCYCPRYHRFICCSSMARPVSISISWLAWLSPPGSGALLRLAMGIAFSYKYSQNSIPCSGPAVLQKVANSWCF
jgi:hypothetical protein